MRASLVLFLFCELSERPLLGRPVFIREVRISQLWHNFGMLYQTTRDQENESRFGATPVPGKIGMAMVGQGLTVGPLPRPAYNNSFGSNPGNQVYVGNASISSPFYCLVNLIAFAVTLPGWLAT